MNSAKLPNLENLRRYLLARGWFRTDHPNHRIELLQTAPDYSGDFASVAIPVSTDLRDASAPNSRVIANSGIPFMAASD